MGWTRLPTIFPFRCWGWSQRCFDFLSRHAVSKNRQLVAQINHLIKAITKKSSVIAMLSITLRKQPPLNIYLRVLTIRNHPVSQKFMRIAGVLQGLQSNVFNPIDRLVDPSTCIFIDRCNSFHPSCQCVIFNHFFTGVYREACTLNGIIYQID